MTLRDLILHLDHQPATALLAEATGAEIFWLRQVLDRWQRLAQRELIARYPLFAEDGEPAAAEHPQEAAA